MTAIDATQALHPVLPSTAAEDSFARTANPGQGHTQGHPATGRTVPAQATQDLLLELAGVSISLADTTELPAGAELSLKLTTTAQGAALSMQAAPGTTKLPEVVAQALREVLPKSGSLAALLPSLLTTPPDPASPLPPAGDPALAPSTHPTQPSTTQPSADPALGGPTTAREPSQAPAHTPSAGASTSVVVDPAQDDRLGLTAESAPKAKGMERLGLTGTGEHAAVSLAAEEPAAALEPKTATGPVTKAPGTEASLASGSRLGVPGTSLPVSAPTARNEPESHSPAPAAGTTGMLSTQVERHPGTASALTSRVVAADAAGTGTQANTTAQTKAGPVHFPDKVAEALAALASQVPDVATLREPAGVATALQRSGLMLEAHLADPSAEPSEHIAGDLKAALLVLRETVAQERAQPLATPAPTAEAVSTATSEAHTALRNLSDTVDGALARISLNQLQLAQAEPSLMSFSVELPVRLGNGAYEPVELIFEREGHAAAGEHSVTTLTLRMRPPELGPITAVLRLRGEHLSTELWAEAPATRAQLFVERERLSAQLRSAGLDAPTVSVSQQAPARAQRLPQGLVNTTV